MGKTNGQVMLLTVLVLGGVILGSSAIAGYLMVVKLRQATNVVNSTKAVFAADAGMECELYKYNFSDPINPRNINCSALEFDGNVDVNTQFLNAAYVKSAGNAFGSRRSFTIDFSPLVGPPQITTIDLKERNCGRCSNDVRETYIAWYAENGDCEAQFNQPGNKQIEVKNYGSCVCGRCSNIEPSTYVEWAPYYNVCETIEAYSQDRQEFTCDSRCWQQPNCSDTTCSGGACGERQTETFSQWYGPGGDCGANKCFVQNTSTYNSPECPFNPPCPPSSTGTSTGTVFIGSGNVMANLFEAFKNLFAR